MNRKIVLAVVLIIGITATLLIDNVDFSKPVISEPPDGDVSVGVTVPNDSKEPKDPDDVIKSDDPLEVMFSQKAGFYDKDISVELSCADKNASIYYTMDGSPPDENSRLYTAPIQIRAGNDVRATTIKAIAILPDDGNTSPEIVTTAVTIPDIIPDITPVRYTSITSLGDGWLYYGRTSSDFFNDAFDITNSSGWGMGTTPIGFGNEFPSHGTTIPFGTGHLERGTPVVVDTGNPEHDGYANHTFTYFKKAFDFNVTDSFNFDSIISFAALHEIDDCLIIYINGIEIYRFNIVQPAGVDPNSTSDLLLVGGHVEWDEFCGINLNPRLLYTSTENDYSPRPLIDTNVESGWLYEAGSLSNLKNALKPGENIITAVVGQNSRSSSDLHFNLAIDVLFECCTGCNNCEIFDAVAVQGDTYTPTERNTTTSTTRSSVKTVSYVTGRNVFNRFDSSTLIFVLSIDPYDLYDYYEGIANDGFLRDQYINSDEYRGGEITPPAPANYNKRGREAERNVYVEVFDYEGSYLINQAGGARVAGGWSRARWGMNYTTWNVEWTANEQMSWSLFARKEYGDSGKFKYPFFGEDLSSDGQLITRYDAIRLRNNANDRENAAIRDELSQDLARQAGFPDTQAARPAAVFLNGEYYGFSWLKESYGNGYLESHYGGKKENYQIVGKSENAWGGEEFAVLDYQYVYQLAENGLTDDAIFADFCSKIDIENLMLYYAVQVFIDNKDWPNNNVRLWRYYPDDGEIIDNPFNDGKWRFLMYDVEFGWGLYEHDHRADTLRNILTGNNHMGGKSVLLSALLEREDMRIMFANTMCDLLDDVFTTENILRTLNELIAKSNKEHKYAIDNDYIRPDSPGWPDWGTVEASRSKIRDFARNRPAVVYRSIRDNLGFDDNMYNITLTVPDGAMAYFNSRKLNNAGTISGSYFTGTYFDIGMQAYSGYEFDYWIINGTTYNSEKMTITPSMVVGGAVNIVLVVKKFTGEQDIYISAVHSGKNGRIELYNPNEAVFSTAGLFLSNDINNLKKWSIPAMNISPESPLLIVCKNNNDTEALMKAQTNFNIKGGQVLYLSDNEGRIISYVSIVDMKEDEELRRNADGSYAIVKKW
ncbi:MAG: CotH kinase family protein [Oscillospiraceae bacterium]|nr:CotH kinase family protein [Oscillospiraceae bacterium]